MRLIGINGFKRSGKGETGLAIKTLLDDVAFETTHLLGFADKLKILGAKSLGFVDRSDAECIALMDECKEEWIFSIQKRIHGDWTNPTTGGVFASTQMREWHTLTGREYLQHMGTQARHVFGEDFWVDQVLPRPTKYKKVDNHWHGLQRVKARYPGVSAVAFTDLRFENEAQRVLDLGGEVWEVIRPGTGSDGHDSEQVLPRDLVTRQIHNSSDLLNLRFQVEKALEL
jgi:hypothetical protein